MHVSSFLISLTESDQVRVVPCKTLASFQLRVCCSHAYIGRHLLKISKIYRYLPWSTLFPRYISCTTDHTFTGTEPEKSYAARTTYTAVQRNNHFELAGVHNKLITIRAYKRSAGKGSPPLKEKLRPYDDRDIWRYSMRSSIVIRWR